MVGQMKKVEKRDPPKGGNSEFKSHFKQSSYLCQCHICALTNILFVNCQYYIS